MEVVPLGLATFALAKLVAKEKVAAEIREPFVEETGHGRRPRGSGLRYAVDEPAHYVDPTTGTVLVRFINDASDSVGFSLDLSITGDIRP